MRAEIVAVGTELLLGQIVNTNAAWMGERLASIGVDVLHRQVVGDNIERIVAALRLAASRADVVLVTGGLGPTGDDVTRDAIAVAMGVGMERHPEIEALLREKFARFSASGAMPESNLRQADVPIGARYLVPERGTAPGLVAIVDSATVYAMAGVPAEMREVMEGTVLPELSERTEGAIVSRVVRVTGMGESAVAEVLEDVFEGSENPTVAYLAGIGDVKIRVTAKATSAEDAGMLIAPVVEEIRGRLGDVVYSETGEALEDAVMRLLVTAGKTLACAESLTGGGVGERLTLAPGASASFKGTAVVYTAEAKHRVLGVPREILEGPGVVSSPCAIAMANGARDVYETDIGLALTGVAGPEPHGGKEPGTVVVALAAGRGPPPPGVGSPRGRPRPGGGGGPATACAGGPSRPASTSCGDTSSRSRSPPRRSTSEGRSRMARDRSKRPEAKSRRLFVAIEVPEEAQRALDRAIAPWREELPQARWSPVENRHVTSKFLGAVWPRLFDRVGEAVAGVARDAEPFEVSLSGLGRFPPRGKARVLWAGLEDRTGGLAALARNLDEVLAPDFASETRQYHAHLTVARSDPPLRVAERWESTSIEPVTWLVDQLALFESHLRRPHARYEVIALHPFAG